MKFPHVLRLIGCPSEDGQTSSPYAERQLAIRAQPKHQTTGNPHKGKPEKNKLLKFHGSQKYFLFVDG